MEARIRKKEKKPTLSHINNEYGRNELTLFEKKTLDTYIKYAYIQLQMKKNHAW